jgi:hypothetical protein
MSTIRALVPMVLVAVVVGGCSSGSSAPVVATGSVTCSDVSGSVEFAPPLTTNGSAAETVSISLTAKGCTTHGSNVSQIDNGKIVSSLSVSSNACAGLLNPQPVAVDVTWTPDTVHASTIHLSGYSIAVGPSGGGGFTLPNKGGTSTVNGSFAGSDHGSSSTSAIYSDEGVGALVAACGSASGLASIAVTSGHLALR